MGYQFNHYPIMLLGIQYGLAEGIPNIREQPWKILEVAVKNVEPDQRPRLYHDWQLMYKPGKPSKRQRLDLEAWGLTSAQL